MMATKKWKRILSEQLQEGTHNNFNLGLGIGVGIFMGIIPIWGCQMIVAVGVAHILKLNKPIVLLFSNISIPPVMPFILFASLQLGSFLVTGNWLSIAAERLTLEVCFQFISYYLVGSVVLAFACGTLSFLLAWYLLHSLREVRP
jgi:uncharacterized protein (DUF2062 family)